MIPLFIYALKVIVISGCLFGYYFLILRNERFHEWNRYYLVLSSSISLILPFIKWSALFSNYSSSKRIYVAELQSITIQASGHLPHSGGWSWITWMGILYALIAIIFIVILTTGLVKIKNRIRQGNKQRFPVFTLVTHPLIDSPFSFFRYIFWNDTFSLKTPEGIHIFRHELAHVQEKHSADKLWMEIILAVGWINPFFHLMRKELHIIHEFIADRRACSNSNSGDPEYFSPHDYASLLVRQYLQTPQISLANHFFQRQLSRRVKMIVRDHKSKFSYIKRVMAIPIMLAVALFFIFLQSQAKSIPFNLNKKISTVSKSVTNTFLKPMVEISPKNISGKADEHTPLTMPKPAPPVLKREYLQTPPPSVSVSADVQDVGFLQPKNRIFTFVEHMPSYPGGEPALMNYLDNQIHIPSEARKQNIQGTVVVQFVVGANGHLSDITTVGRKIGGGLEDEAIRAVKGMPDWIPGRQKGKKVNVQYSLPIRFVQENNSSKTTNDHQINEPPPPQSPSPSIQPEANFKTSNKVFQFVEQMPTFPGGSKGMMEYLHDHIHYPTVARENGIQGTIVVQFIIGTDGHLSDIHTVGPEKGGGLEEEAIRVTKSMPDWNPGKQNGQDVAVQYSMPIRFVLQ